MASDTRRLGATGIVVPAIGVGTNRWGGHGATQDGLQETYTAALDAGAGFFDTAEVYSGGRSETALGSCARADPRDVVVASKFAPLPTRLVGRHFAAALDRTLRRMGRDTIDLYYVHFPYSLVGFAPWVKAMVPAFKSGKIRSVGVSNFSARQMRRAVDILERDGIPLAANQVQYSVRHRKPETNGVLDACRELDVALVAYRPISGGTTGTDKLAGLLEEIATSHGATPTQVALRWLVQRDDHVIAIPGSTKPHHARDNAAAMDFTLSDDEIDAIASA